MLVELQIRNYGLIDSLNVEFGSGLNVISGETGVGKSMLISAVKFLHGARSSSTAIRSGKDECSVTGVFVLPSSRVSWLRGLFPDSRGIDQEIIVRRSLGRNGRNRCTLNDELMTTRQLGAITRALVDMHGQHDEQSILLPLTQLELLDGYARVESKRAEFASAYQTWAELVERQASLAESEEQRQKQLELLRYQLKEISDADVKIGEYEELRRQQDMYSQIQEILTRGGAAQNEIAEADGCIVERIERCRSSLHGYEGLHPLLGDCIASLDEALEQLQNSASKLATFCYDQEYEDGQLEQVQARLDELTNLRMKYGKDESEILQHAQEIEQELERLSGEETESSELGEQLINSAREAQKLGIELTRQRKAAVKKLQKAVEAELKSLGMPAARFEVQVLTHGDLSDATLSGMNEIEFGFCANSGEDVLPLADVASGGEVSRVFLAIKSILAASDLVPVLIFDEIDSNVGGRLGSVVGSKLQRLSAHHQLICVTHLPQIASFADQHLKITKGTRKGRTTTSASMLGQEERLKELAQMMRGSGATDVTIQEAKDMLSEACLVKETG